MAAPWTAQRRPQVPTSPPQPKTTISMEDWEAKSPLGELELRSVSSLKPICEDRRLPLKVRILYGRTLTAPSSPSRPSTPSGRPELGSSLHPHHHLHPKHPIQTPEQFHDWFALVERSVAHSQEAHFRSHLEDVSEYRMMCEKLLETIDDVESEVDGMLYEWMRVEEGGSSLKDACERLLEERDSLIETTEAIALRLEYFQELEHATRMLNHPGESLVLQTDFLLMVERVDVCLEFLEAHRDFREVEIYLLRFQQCLTRAMTLIKMFFVGSLKALTADIQRRISDKEISETAQLHLLYSKFSSASFQVAPLLAELERRAKVHPDELASLLAECHAAYLGARKSLLIGRLMEDIKGLDPAHSELVELTRTGCTYLRQLCMDEFDLYRRFFNTGEDRLYRYLESLCDYLFDDLRPRILHEPRLTILCEVCTVLQAVMVLDIQPSNLPSSNAVYDDEDGTETTSDAADPTRKGLGHLHIKPILQMVLQDAQTRLLFKAQALMESEIRSYKPKQDDLAYPDKLVDNGLTDRSGLELIEKEDKIIRQLFPLPSLQKQATWYPTLRKTLWILSQLHEFINSAVFSDVSQEAIVFCRQSLKLASEELFAKNLPNSYLDGQLFLIRHLLILKDMTANLEFNERGSRGRGVAGYLDAFGSVIRGTSALLNSTGLFDFGDANSQGEMDARIGIDQDLKTSCESMISRCADAATESVRKFLERGIAFKSLNDADTSSAPLALAETEFANATTVIEVDTTFRATCEKEVSMWLTQSQLYLEDQKAVLIMVVPLQAKIVEIYSAFRDLVGVEYPPEIMQALLSPTDFRTFLHKICLTPP
ncbi:Sec34-like family-domain-containing protein [Hysterangium stoloniferum]|nr:Sec34-like family-domain-containing protein [Hysterangium stoloniferum]